MQKKRTAGTGIIGFSPDRQSGNEDLLASMSKNFISMSFIMIDNGISGSLESLCKHIKADGAFIFFPDQTMTEIDNIYIYCENQDDPLRRLTNGMPINAEEHFFDLLSGGKNVKIESIKDFPPGKKHGCYFDDGFRPIFIIPVMYDEKLKGSLGVCGKRGIVRKWEDDDARMLFHFSDIIAHAYIRKKREEHLHPEHPELDNIIKTVKHVVFIISCKDERDPIIQEFNYGADLFFGYERDELIGKPISRLFFPESLSVFRTRAEALSFQMNDTGKNNYEEGIFRKKSGEPFPALYGIYPLSGVKGKSGYILQIIIDIADRKEIEKALLTAEQEKALILSSVSELLIYLDTHLAIKWANKAACDQIGFACGEITGKHCYEVWMEKKTTCRKCTVAEALATGKNAEGEISTKDGRIWLSRAYPVKSQAGIIIGAVEVIEEITQLKKAEEKLRLLQFSIDHSAVATLWIDADARMVYVNDMACESLGYTKEELLSLKVSDIDLHYTSIVWPDHWKDIRTKKAFSIITEHRKKDGTVFPVEVMLNYVNFEGREYNFAFAIDLSEKKKAAEEKSKLEDQLIQARRMEALGRLAQGVAHDFNNILTGMQGYVHFIKHNLNRDNPLQHDVNEIKRSIERAAGLTEQLLAFNKKQATMPHILDINAIIDEAHNMLLRIIGEEIGLVIDRKTKHGNIRFDQHQMDQILVSLAVYVRDRIPAGGNLLIETELIDIIENTPNTLPGINPGEYIVLRMGNSNNIHENGIQGYDQVSEDEIKSFCSGLDLSSVYSLLDQNDCHLKVLSKKGNEAIFEIFIPVIKNPVQKDEEVIVQYKNLPRGNETILLVEDEEMVRSFTKRFLTYQGYKVMEASRSPEAIRICRSYNRKIHLLLTDVVMPELSGRELFEHLKDYLPDMKVLYMSGYSGDIIASHGIRDDDPNFIYKPFSIESLTQKIRMILDDAAGC